MSNYYDTMQVCKKSGHKITDLYDSGLDYRQDFYEKCGSATVNKCIYCSAKIRGWYHIEGIIGGRELDVPLNCHKCGEPYPWRRKLVIKKIGTMVIVPLKYIADSIVDIFKKIG